MTEVFIYGSCTTRDSVEFWPEDIELAGYVARQSLVSAVAGGHTRGFDIQAVKSTFQKRMIKHDLNGAAVDQVLSALDSGAFVVWDLTDERNGLVELDDGRICSAVAIAQKELVQKATTVRRTKFTDPEFLQEWKKAAVAFSRKLGERKCRVIVNYTPWAQTFEDGASVSDAEVPTVAFNQQLKIMIEHLESLGFPVMKIKHDEVRSKREHKWGPAPFHYDDQTYRTMISRIQTKINQS